MGNLPRPLRGWFQASRLNGFSDANNKKHKCFTNHQGLHVGLGKAAGQKRKQSIKFRIKILARCNLFSSHDWGYTQ